VSEATASIRDSSRADLIGPRVVLLVTHPAALPTVNLRVLGQKINEDSATGLLAAAVEDVLQGIKRPGDPVARARIRLLELANPHPLPLDSGTQCVALALCSA
jgi:hypothetical protein